MGSEMCIRDSSSVSALELSLAFCLVILGEDVGTRFLFRLADRLSAGVDVVALSLLLSIFLPKISSFSGASVTDRDLF